jgi:hypothetical protein
LSHRKIEILFGNEILLEKSFGENKANLKIICENQLLNFYVNDNLILENIDMKPLSTEAAGGFVGNTIGFYKIGDKNFDNFKNFEVCYI